MTNIEIPRWLSEYLAERLQSLGRIWANADVDVKRRQRPASNAGALNILEITSHVYSSAVLRQQAVRRWRLWVAHASRVLAKASRFRELFRKIVLARRQNQHARRLRYPESVAAVAVGCVRGAIGR